MTLEKTTAKQYIRAFKQKYDYDAGCLPEVLESSMDAFAVFRKFQVNVHRRLLTLFFEAVNQGRVDQLESLLVESVELYSDGGGKVQAVGKVLTGNAQVAKFFRGLARLLEKSGPPLRMEVRRFNGVPGLLHFEEDTLTTSVSLELADGKIKSIYALRNPDKLRQFYHLTVVFSGFSDSTILDRHFDN